MTIRKWSALVLTVALLGRSGALPQQTGPNHISERDSSGVYGAPELDYGYEEPHYDNYGHEEYGASSYGMGDVFGFGGHGLGGGTCAKFNLLGFVSGTTAIGVLAVYLFVAAYLVSQTSSAMTSSTTTTTSTTSSTRQLDDAEESLRRMLTSGTVSLTCQALDAAYVQSLQPIEARGFGLAKFDCFEGIAGALAGFAALGGLLAYALAQGLAATIAAAAAASTAMMSSSTSSTTTTTTGTTTSGTTTTTGGATTGGATTGGGSTTTTTTTTGGTTTGGGTTTTGGGTTGGGTTGGGGSTTTTTGGGTTGGGTTGGGGSSTTTTTTTTGGGTTGGGTTGGGTTGGGTTGGGTTGGGTTGGGTTGVGGSPSTFGDGTTGDTAGGTAGDTAGGRKMTSMFGSMFSLDPTVLQLMTTMANLLTEEDLDCSSLHLCEAGNLAKRAGHPYSMALPFASLPVSWFISRGQSDKLPSLCHVASAMTHEKPVDCRRLYSKCRR